MTTWRPTGGHDEGRPPPREGAGHLFDAALRTSMDGVALVGLDGRFREVNEAFASLLGRSRSEAVTMTLADLEAHPAPDLLSARVESLRARGGEKGRFRWRRADDREVEVEALAAAGSDADDAFVLCAREVRGRPDGGKGLQDAERRLLRIVGDIQDATLKVDLAGRLVLASDSAARMYGRGSVGELLGVAPEDFWESPEWWRELLAEAREQGQVDDRIGRGRREDGSLFWASVSARLVRDDDGRPLGTAVVVRDVTVRQELLEEHERSEALLREHLEEVVRERTARLEAEVAERRAAQEALTRAVADLRDLYDHAPCGYHSLDGTGLFVDVNATELAWLGYAREEVVGRLRFPDLLTPASLETFRRAFPAFLKTGVIRDLEFEVVRKDGSTFWALVSATAVRDSEGRYVKSRSTVFDVTRRKRAEKAREAAEEARRQAEQRWMFALEGSGQGVWDWNVATGDVWFSKRWKEMLGHSEDEIANRREEWETRIHPDDKEQVFAAVGDCLAGRTPVYELVHRVRCKDGSWKWILDRGMVFERDADGKPLRMTGTHTDVTGRKRAEEDLRESYRRLEEANAALERAGRMRDQFLASLSHELRTPLATILGQAALFREKWGGTLSSGALSDLEALDAGGRQLQRLVEGVLELARADAGKVSVEIAPCRLFDLAEAAAGRVGERARARRQEVTVSVDPPGTSVVTDAQLLQRLLGELLDNALKFTPEGGRVGLEVRGDGEAGVARFTVWDTGIGISPDGLARIFEPFVQLDGRTERLYGGAGVGLPLARRLAALLGGDLEVKSASGRGSRFTLTLPWADRAGAEEEAAPAAAGPSSGTFVLSVPAATGIHLAERLPAELRDALRSAVERANLDAIARAVEELELRDPDAADVVRELADRFDYEALLRELDAG